MRRQAYERLARWKDDPDRKPLIVEGVRQCGKTHLVMEFGKENYDDVAYFNFEDDRDLCSHFEHNLDPHRIVEELGLMLGRAVVPGRTLIFFDEIQFCNRAITSLKYFCENASEHHVICAGSLLGVRMSQPYSFPVGKVNRLRLYPMNFYEFLAANGEGMLCEYLEKLPVGEKAPDTAEAKLIGYLHRYYVVGGMPEAVKKWVSTKDIEAVEEIQDGILRDYADDFSKHAAAEVNELTIIWRSIPQQLSKENKRFIFSHVREGARAKDLEHALEWMISAGLVHKVRRISEPMAPLSAYSDERIFKIYFADVGLLRRLAGVDSRFVFDASGRYKHFKGAMAENHVLNELLFIGKSPYFWRSEGVAEVDFVDDFGVDTVPIEVKAETNTKSKSLSRYIDQYHPRLAVKVSMNNVGKNGVIGLPLWLVWRIKDYVDAGRLDASVADDKRA
ncbi:MAG: ATP-binding protein [Candidatus Methanoplasma sp.]|jgi:predicted AAA+ superfamily ATPase|nr:ATP-binding protein [Candidatus Methanoplasma sp.]